MNLVEFHLTSKHCRNPNWVSLAFKKLMIIKFSYFLILFEFVHGICVFNNLLLLFYQGLQGHSIYMLFHNMYLTKSSIGSCIYTTIKNSIQIRF